jgi:hypothetical protein
MQRVYKGIRAGEEFRIPAFLLYINIGGWILVWPISPTNLDYDGRGTTFSQIQKALPDL